MVLVIVSIIIGIFSAIAAIILQLKYTGWELLCGIHAIPSTRLSHIDVHKLRRKTSFLLYVLAVGFICGALFLYLKLISEAIITPAYFIFIQIIFNIYFFISKLHDHNEQIISERRGRRIIFAGVNLLFVLILLLSLP